MSKYPTDEMVDAAVEAARLPQNEFNREAMRAALIAADRAAWKPIAHHEATDEWPHEGSHVLAWGNDTGFRQICDPWTLNIAVTEYSRREIYIRSFPSPPITTADQASTARIETAEVPASPAVVLPTGDAGENPIEQLVALGFRQGAGAMRERVACLYYSGGLMDYASDIRAIPIPEMPEMKK